MTSPQVSNNVNLSLCEESKPKLGLRKLYDKRQLSNQEIKDESEHIEADQEKSIRFELRSSFKHTDIADANDGSITFLLRQSSHNQIFLASDFYQKISGSERSIKTNEEPPSYKGNGRQSLLKKVLSKRALKKK